MVTFLHHWHIQDSYLFGKKVLTFIYQTVNRLSFKRTSPTLAVELSFLTTPPPPLFRLNPATRRRKVTVSDPSNSSAVITQCRLNRHNFNSLIIDGGNIRNDQSI